MPRARPAVLSATITLCVGLVVLASCSGVGVDQEASPASTEKAEATGRSRSSEVELMPSTTTTTIGPPTTTNTSTAASSSTEAPSSPNVPGSTTPTGTPTTGGPDDPEQAARPVGFGEGTTGGAGGPTTTVSSAAALAEAVAGDEPRVVEVAGTIALDGMVEVGSNKTIEGASDPADAAGPAELVGGGLRIASADNVIVRNLTVTGSSGDDIGVEGSTDVWIDHNDLSAAAHAALGIGRGADRITVSWNHFHDQGDTAVLGHSDGDVTLDTGRLRVTYHHNWFDGTTRYSPRVRFGNPVHVVNNYFSDITGDGVASTSGAGVLVEANAFDGVDDPFHTGDGDSLPGALVARDNHMVGSGVGRTGGVVAAIPYDYAPDPATEVKSLVTAYAGPRRPA